MNFNMISKEKIKHIAQLAKLYLTSEEEEKLQKEISSILDYIEQLSQVDTTNVEPASQFLSEIFDSQESVLTREDKIKRQDTDVVDNLFKMAPETKGKSFKVKPIFGENRGKE